MKTKQNKKLDSSMTYLLVLLFCVYAFVVCYCCYAVLNDQKDFGVVASTKGDIVWRVTD